MFSSEKRILIYLSTLNDYFFSLKFFFINLIYLVLEREEGTEKGEKHQCVVASHRE